MATAMISFLGEQPIPNLLPAQFYRPDLVVLVYTDRTEGVHKRLRRLIKSAVRSCFVDPYEIVKIHAALDRMVAEAGLEKTDLVLNLTGGTKAMILAGYRLAEARKTRFMYLQTEGKVSRIYQYRFTNDGPLLDTVDTVPGILTIDEYLKAHLERYTVTGPASTPGGDFEVAVAEALGGAVDEIEVGVKVGGALDIDVVVRCGNQVGIAEVKSGNSARKKEGIGQLATAGGREFLGTYHTRFLIVDSAWTDLSDLRDLAKAREIVLIELPGYQGGRQLGETDKQKLIQLVQQHLGCPGGGS